MTTTRELLGMPITYDIIVSDFGRDATKEYLRLLADSEKRKIETILQRDAHEFFDEYRRLMFTVIGDLAYFKHRAIAESALSVGYLTEDILIGLGQSSMSQEFVHSYIGLLSALFRKCLQQWIGAMNVCA